MKIAIFTDTFVPLIDGVVTFVKNLSKELADRGHKVYIICPSFKKSEEFRYKNIEVIRIPGIPSFFYKGFKFASPFNFRLYKYLKRENIDIIHFQTPISMGIQAIIISKLLKRPIMGTYHTNISDPSYLKHIKINNSFMQKLSWAYLKLYYNRCSLITCPSEETKKELSEKGFKKEIKAISNGIRLDIFKDYTYKKKKKENILLFVSRIAHEKNIPYLLECFSLVLKKMPKTKLIIVGDGPQFKEISELIKEKGLSENVTMTGKIEHEKLLKSSLFKKCDLFVTASTTEVLPISILEAQANGLVCIGINKGGVKDLIKNDYNGFLLELGDKEGFAEKIIELLSNKNLYKKMQKNTFQEVKRHDLKKIVKEWETLYKEQILNMKNEK